MDKQEFVRWLYGSHEAWKKGTQMRNALTVMLLLCCHSANADAPIVEDISATKSGDAWTFNVTVRHPDTGWDHYADGWEVAGADGTQYGYRKLLHPHENEQPFTRSLSGVEIPPNVTSVTVRAHDSVHKWGEPVSFELN